MLVVVEHGDVAQLLQLRFDLKAPGRRDILQIDSAEGTGDQMHRIDKFIHILALDTQREGIHIAECLEQGAFALHDRHTCLGTDIAQAQHGAAVGDHSAEIMPPGQLVALVQVFLDLQTGLCHAGGVGQGQLFLGGHRNS